MRTTLTGAFDLWDFGMARQQYD